jgi:hypothetical protein
MTSKKSPSDDPYLAIVKQIARRLGEPDSVVKECDAQRILHKLESILQDYGKMQDRLEAHERLEEAEHRAEHRAEESCEPEVRTDMVAVSPLVARVARRVSRLSLIMLELEETETFPEKCKRYLKTLRRATILSDRANERYRDMVDRGEDTVADFIEMAAMAVHEQMVLGLAMVKRQMEDGEFVDSDEEE